MIKVRNLSKTFKVHKKREGLIGSIQSLYKRDYITKSAVKNVNLDIEQGEIIGLIGSNGAGKTTLTKMLAGIIHPSQGEINIMGHRPWDRKNEFRRNMSLIMGQKAQLWWDLPAMDGFLLLKEIYQINKKDFYQRIEFLSDKLSIKNELNIQVRRLSLGERMKVELIAALLHNPKVVFLDEPTIGLDLTAQKSVRSFIKDYRKEFNPVMILTSHYMDDIEELCKRVIIMKDGQFIHDASLSQIQEQFATTKLIKVYSEQIIDNIPQELGSLKSQQEGEFLFQSPRDKVLELAAFLIQKHQVKDLTIKEEEVGDLIEKIMLDKR